MTFHKYKISILLFFIFHTFGYAQYNIQAYITNARKEISSGNFADAIAKLNTCISVQPDNCEAYFYRAACKYSLFDYLGAEQDFTMALSNYSPVYYDAYYYRSGVRYRLGNYTGAIEDLNKVIKKNSKNSGFYIERAFALLANNNFNAALSDCKKALSLHAISANVYVCKAAAEEAIEDYESALTDYNTALKINSKADNTYVRRGITRFKMGNIYGAIDDYNQAIKINQACTFAYYNRAEAEIKLDDIKSAMSDYDTVIFYEPRNSYAYFNRAILNANKQNIKAAIEDFDKVIILNPDNIQALFNRAKLKQDINEYKDAVSDYNKLIELYPYFVEAYYNRSQIKTILKDVNGAKKDIETGNIMSAVFQAKTNMQLFRDSVLLSRLSYLSADFEGVSEIKTDTTDINFRPVFYLTEKDSTDRKQIYYSILLDNFNRKNAGNLILENSPAGNYLPMVFHTDSIIVDNNGRESQLVQAIRKSNMQLFNEAGEMLNRIISADSLNALAYFARGINTCRLIEMMNNAPAPYIITNPKQSNLRNERFEKCQLALSDFSKALVLAPDFPYAYYNRANIKCLIDDFNAALFDYEQAVKHYPGFADAFYNYGYVLYHLNMKQEACHSFSRAGELGMTGAFSFIRKYCSGIVK